MFSKITEEPQALDSRFCRDHVFLILEIIAVTTVIL